MNTPAGKRITSATLIGLLIPLALYTACVIPGAIWHRHQINPDAVVYIQFAKYIAHGDFSHSISGYWSPLLSWCMAPLIAMHMDGLHAARLVLAVWGGLMVTAFYFFTRTIHAIGPVLRTLVSCIVAMAAVTMAVGVIAPDVILAACLFAYFAAVIRPTLAENRRHAFTTGLLAGVAFYAKAYAFPFFLLHFPLTLLVRRFGPTREPARADAQTLLTTWLAGMAGFALLTLPWVTVLSAKYHHLTFSTTGSAAHAIMHPDIKTPHAPLEFGLAPSPFITLKEIPETLPYRYWSPFSSKRNFVHQLHIVVTNVKNLADSVLDFDWLPLLPTHDINARGGISYHSLHFAFPALILTLFLLRYLPRTQRTNAVWLWLTSLAYVSGFLLVFCEDRYLRLVLLPLALVLTLQLVYVSGRRSVESASTGCWIAMVRVSAATLVFFAFSFAVIADFRHVMAQPVDPTFRNVAAKLQTLKLQGNIASSDWGRGLYVAYHMNRSYLGFPVEVNDQTAARKLNDFHASALLVWPEPGSIDGKGKTLLQADRVARAGGWKLAMSIPVPVHKESKTRIRGGKPVVILNDKLRVYVPDSAAAPTTQSIFDPDEEMFPEPD